MKGLLSNTDYSYKRLMDLKFYRGKSAKMEKDILTLDYQVSKKKDLNLELELRKIVMEEAMRKIGVV